MHWIAADLLMFVSSIVLFLLVRAAALAKVPVQFNNLAMFGIPAVVFWVICVVTRTPLTMPAHLLPLMLLTGVVLSYLPNAASLKSIALAPNPGYSLIIAKSYVVLTTFLAVPLLHAPLTRQAVAAISMIVASSALILVQRRAHRTTSLAWLLLALMAFVGWAFLALASKYLFQHGVQTATFLAYLFLIVTICIALEMRIRHVPLAVVRKRPRRFVVIGFCSAIWNWFLFYAISLAPNPGYVSATNAASIGAVTVFAILLFKDELSPRKLAGVVGIIIGLLLLFLG